MNQTEIIVVALATIAGPILAVQAQKWIERATERNRTRRAVFHALMANRATRLNDDFVRALNSIDLEFGQKRGNAKDRAVIDSWRSLFGEYGVQPDANDQAAVHNWVQRIEDRLVAMLLAMSKAVGYEFSEEQLRRGIYYPKGRVDLEQNQLAIIEGVRRLVEGKSALQVKNADERQ